LIRTPQAKKAAPSPWEFRQHPDAAALLTSNLLIPAATNVLFPAGTRGPQTATPADPHRRFQTPSARSEARLLTPRQRKLSSARIRWLRRARGPAYTMGADHSADRQSDENAGGAAVTEPLLFVHWKGAINPEWYRQAEAAAAKAPETRESQSC